MVSIGVLSKNSPGIRELTGPQESAYQAGPGARELYLRTRRDAMKEAQNDDVFGGGLGPRGDDVNMMWNFPI